MSSDLDSSLLLLERARHGDQAALDELLVRYLPRMKRWATGRLPRAARNMLDTEDVVQETMVKTVRNLGHLEINSDGALQAYLRQALTNRFADAYRRSRTRGEDTVVTTDLPAPNASPLEEAIGADALERYEAALARLSASDREAIVLRIELCHDYDQIAMQLGKTTAASARVAVSRALARLAREMRQA